jgi:hypothetical protein
MSPKTKAWYRKKQNDIEHDIYLWYRETKKNIKGTSIRLKHDIEGNFYGTPKILLRELLWYILHFRQDDDAICYFNTVCSVSENMNVCLLV